MSKEKKERNVPDEIWDVWQSNKRQGDAQEIMKELDISYPTITGALKRGFVAKGYLVTAITQFFTDRREREIGDAQKLNNLSPTNTVTHE